MSDKKKNKNLWILLPVTLALAVFIGLSVSGNITKNSDKNTPTATTEVSVVNEDQTQKQNDEVVNSKVTLVAVGDNLIHNTLIAA